jgi:hypothetical protein
MLFNKISKTKPTKQKSVDLRANWKTKNNQQKIVAVVFVVWLSLPKTTYYTKLKICQKQNCSLFQLFLFMFV